MAGTIHCEQTHILGEPGLTPTNDKHSVTFRQLWETKIFLAAGLKRPVSAASVSRSDLVHALQIWLGSDGSSGSMAGDLGIRGASSGGSLTGGMAGSGGGMGLGSGKFGPAIASLEMRNAGAG
jgi:hypothetical protein